LRSAAAPIAWRSGSSSINRSSASARADGVASDTSSPSVPWLMISPGP
jgi:hypothetical protein